MGIVRGRAGGLSMLIALVLVLLLGLPGAVGATPPSSTYRTPSQVRAALREVAAAHPDIVELSSYGESALGRSLPLVKISDHVERDESEPEVLVTARIHAREHVTVEVALALIGWLTDGYGTDDRVTRIVDTTEVYIAPDMNPDGAAYDLGRTTPRSWRKNRQPAGGSVGTDLNRNFGYRWGCCGGSSARASDPLYRGTAAFSAPETRAIRSLVKIRAFTEVLNLHSYGQQVLWPYGYTMSDRPSDLTAASLATVKRLARGIAKRNDYTAMQASDLYITSGSFMDWAMGKLRLPALTMELAPETRADGGFYLRASAMRATVRRNKDALLWFLEQAGDPSGG